MDSSRKPAQTLIEYKMGEILARLKTKSSPATAPRNHRPPRALCFRSQTEKYELSDLYQAKIRNMGNPAATRANTIRRARSSAPWSAVVKPKIGKRISDGACGSRRLLPESLDYLKSKKGLTTKNLEIFQERTFVRNPRDQRLLLPKTIFSIGANMYS
jgi:type I restriction enzyme M protein